MSIADIQPDPTRPGPPDVLGRYLYFKDALYFELSTIAVNDTQSRSVTSALRIRDVEVGEVAGGTITVQVQVNGRDIFDDDVRPVSGSEAVHPTHQYNITAGSLVTVTVEAASGVPVAPGFINITTEPFTLLPRTTQRELAGGERFRVSKRQNVVASNDGIDVSPLFPTAVNAPHPIEYPATLGQGIQIVRLRDEVVHFRPRRQR